MSADERDEAAGPLADVLAPRPVRSSEVVFDGAVWDVASERVDLGGDEPVRRDKVVHPGAVGILALDEDERVLLLRQYRHPVRHELWEVPAGLLDEPGEAPQDAAARELREEADLVAGRYDVLAEWYSTPGGSDEALRVYLARDLAPVPEGERFAREHEEADMVLRWVPLDEAVDAVLAGRLHNPTAVVALLAASAARARGWATLRPADAPWPAFDQRRA
ncbi:NUDIX hydrolase [Pseudokineococcus basanitobsidens]|uniref:NUDIX hydrolase n=1 Tax=Pseudokineococcus basanitobsidens TaxID=1926649 RepID=A0ABU8RNI2_9ACTN